MAIGSSYVANAEAAAKAAALEAGEIAVKEDLRPTHLYTNYKEFDRYKAVYRSQKSILGGSRVLFTPEFVSILEEAILRDNMHVLSKEQQAYFDRYCIEADGQLSADMLQFDKFLGEYKEEIING